MTEARENLIDMAWQAMDDRNDVDVSLRDLAEAAVDATAAPDLLAALKAVDDMGIDDRPEVWGQVSAAIAKAEGKP